MRVPLIVANWKMNMRTGDLAAFLDRFVPLVENSSGVEIAIAPPFTLLDRLAQRLAKSAIRCAAQNVHPEECGAFTGEVSAGMLADLGCAYAIVGHSERRTLCGETDAVVARKAAALLHHEIQPIVCVGETLAQRDAGDALGVVRSQLRGSLAEVPPDLADRLVIAYEPVWAIGTGRTATPQIAQQVHAHVRQQLAAQFGDTAERIRIQYGGSVKPETAYALLSQPDIDGALVGGASLEPDSLARIANFQSQRSS